MRGLKQAKCPQANLHISGQYPVQRLPKQMDVPRLPAGIATPRLSFSAFALSPFVFQNMKLDYFCEVLKI